MTGGGIDFEGEMAAARLRLRLEQTLAPAEIDRLRREEGRETFEARLAVLALAGIVFVLLDVFF